MAFQAIIDIIIKIKKGSTLKYPVELMECKVGFMYRKNNIWTFTSETIDEIIIFKDTEDSLYHISFSDEDLTIETDTIIISNVYKSNYIRFNVLNSNKHVEAITFFE